MNYDYLIVGAGLFGATFAHEMTKAGKRCLVIDKRSHTGGNVFCDQQDGIWIHKYGAHIFHTSDKKIWDYVTALAEFNNFVNSPMANYKGEIYNMPFNMNTFSKMWNIATPAEALEILERQRAEIDHEPKNLEEQAIRLVGRDVYEKLVKGYTEKQWGRDCAELPAFIIRRLPVRFTYDNNYFNDRYQGIPVNGYNEIIDKLLVGSEVRLNTDYFEHRDEYNALAKRVLFTGPIDAFFGYSEGRLAWRSLRFETERLEMENYQGVAVVNYTDRETPYTRVIEHKHFAFGQQPVTYITREYPADWIEGMEAYYPVNDEANSALYARYAELAAQQPNMLFGGRLAQYKYHDMDDAIAAALELAEKELA